MNMIPFSGIRKIFQAATELESQGQQVIHLEIGRRRLRALHLQLWNP
jgi:hypothetical protein